MTSTSGRRLLHWTEVALGCLAVALGVRVLLLRGQLAAARTEVAHAHVTNAALRSEALLLDQEVRSYRRLAQGSRIADGTTLRGLSAMDGAVTLQLADLPNAYLFFTIDEKCALCSTWRTFLRTSAIERPCGLTVVGIALNDAPADPSEPDSSGFDLIVRPTGNGWTTLALETPATAVLVAPRGRFLGRWTGPADSRRVAEIRRSALTACATPLARSEDATP